MFKMSAEPRFKHTVEVLVPVDGGHSSETIDVTYRVIGTSAASKHDLNTAAGSASFLKAVVVSVDDVQGENNKPVSFNDLLLDRLLEIPYVRAALARGYFDAIGKASAGN